MWFLKLIVCITPCIFYLCMTCFTPAVLNSSPPPSAFEVVGSIFNYTHTRVSPPSAIVCSRDKACMRQMTSEKLQYIIIGYGLLWTTDTESSSSASRCTIETIHFDTPSVVTHGLRLWGCTAKFSETPLVTAYGREMNIQFTGNSSGGHSCSQHANYSLPQILRHLWHCAIKLHILEWPFIVASLRHTCAIIMLSNQHLDMTHLWGGWILSAKEKCSLTQI